MCHLFKIIHGFIDLPNTPLVYTFKPCIDHFTRYTHPLQLWIRPKSFSVSFRLAVVCFFSVSFLIFWITVFSTLLCPLLLSHLTYNSSCCYGHGHLPEASYTPRGGKVMSVWPRWVMTFRHIHEYTLIMWYALFRPATCIYPLLLINHGEIHAVQLLWDGTIRQTGINSL